MTDTHCTSCEYTSPKKAVCPVNGQTYAQIAGNGNWPSRVIIFVTILTARWCTSAKMKPCLLLRTCELPSVLSQTKPTDRSVIASMLRNVTWSHNWKPVGTSSSKKPKQRPATAKSATRQGGVVCGTCRANKRSESFFFIHQAIGDEPGYRFDKVHIRARLGQGRAGL